MGRGSVYARPGAGAAFLAEAPEMNSPAIAPYLRYNLMLGFWVEQERRPLETVFEAPEDRSPVEVRVRAGLRERG